MSRATPAPYELQLLAFPCARCQAPIGEWCKGKRWPGDTRPALWALDMHMDRYKKLRDSEKKAV